MADRFIVADHQEGITLAAFLRACLPGLSWSKVQALVEQRRVQLNGELWLDSVRRVHVGETVEILKQAAPQPRTGAEIVLRHLDEHVVVVEKPSGMNTVRHPAEREWKEQRKALSPTLEDLVPRRLAQIDKRTSGRLRVVQRLDKETSGLVVFARTVHAERILGRQFHDHTVVRRYLALAHGKVRSGTIHTWLARDRGDGRRGSSPNREQGKEAITHIELLEELPGGYSRIGCRLETGRTHQIRIHLSERGHPILGDKVYVHRADGSVFADRSGAPRLCLHATELGFVHPATGESLRWEMPLPDDMEIFLRGLRAG